MIENTTLKINPKKLNAMLIRTNAMLVVSLQLQAEIISYQQGKDYDTVYTSIMQSVEALSAQVTASLLE